MPSHIKPISFQNHWNERDIDFSFEDRSHNIIIQQEHLVYPRAKCII